MSRPLSLARIGVLRLRERVLPAWRRLWHPGARSLFPKRPHSTTRASALSAHRFGASEAPEPSDNGPGYEGGFDAGAVTRCRIESGRARHGGCFLGNVRTRFRSPSPQGKDRHPAGTSYDSNQTTERSFVSSSQPLPQRTSTRVCPPWLLRTGHPFPRGWPAPFLSDLLRCREPFTNRCRESVEMPVNTGSALAAGGLARRSGQDTKDPGSSGRKIVSSSSSPAPP